MATKFEELENRVDKLEKDWIRTGEQIKTLFNATTNLKQVVYIFALLLLLTVIYGAVGGHGFNAITSSIHKASASPANHFNHERNANNGSQQIQTRN